MILNHWCHELNTKNNAKSSLSKKKNKLNNLKEVNITKHNLTPTHHTPPSFKMSSFKKFVRKLLPVRRGTATQQTRPFCPNCLQPRGNTDACSKCGARFMLLYNQTGNPTPPSSWLGKILILLSELNRVAPQPQPQSQPPAPPTQTDFQIPRSPVITLTTLAEEEERRKKSGDVARKEAWWKEDT